MPRHRWGILSAISAFTLSGLMIIRAADDPTPPDSMAAHGDCTFFGPQRDKFVRVQLKAAGRLQGYHPLTDATEQALKAMAAPPPGGPTYTYGASHEAGSIDSYIWADFQAHGITPAAATTDWEFVRRVTLDLTGRIPTPQAVLAFVNSTDPNKRATYIDSLLASPQWVDKWTMFYGDLFQNTVTKPSTAINRFIQGRNALYQYIHDSLASGKPYNQMASDLIGSADTNSYDNGPINYLVGGYVANGPAQDTFDAQTAQVADQFLGITYVNCLLCHNGAGHLTQVNLWGSQITRYQGWQLASYMSHTQAARTVVTPGNNNVYYWSLQDNTKGYTNDYTLNTTSGNRPARVAPNGCKSGQPCYYVPPQYIFTGDAPRSGEPYRTALAREITGDFQFARAAVNYVWAHFFGMGIVDPPDTFDLARLDPDNPPRAPWTLQPTNAKLLNALATHFVQSGYDVKALMREITNSRTYQLSSRYAGNWSATYEPYFARKYVRRLWSEEVLDAINQSSGVAVSYTYDSKAGTVSYAMQLPDIINVPDDGNTRNFLDAFLRGNRDDQPRKQDGSILQALNLMNNPSVVQARLAATGSSAAPLITSVLKLSSASDMVNTLYLTILSRYPTADEMTAATGVINGAGASTRTQAVQNLAWSLYNKVDFVFNY